MAVTGCQAPHPTLIMPTHSHQVDPAKGAAADQALQLDVAPLHSPLPDAARQAALECGAAARAAAVRCRQALDAVRPASMLGRLWAIPASQPAARSWVSQSGRQGGGQSTHPIGYLPS